MKKTETPKVEFKNVIPEKIDIIRRYQKQKDFAIKLRQVKINNWLKNEEIYNGVLQKSLLTRSNLHAPIMFEGVQNMSAKIGQAPDVEFDTIPEGDENAEELMKHVVKEDLKESGWNLIYENGKIEGGIYGRGVWKVIPGNDKNTIELVDTLSFLIDPLAKNTKDALYCGQQFIYKTIEEIEDEADEMEYDTEEISKLKEYKVPSDIQTSSNTEESQKNIRLQNMGLSNTNMYGSKVAELTEWYSYNKDNELMIDTVANDVYLLRHKKAEESGLERNPFISPGTYTRGITFWCPSVADLYRDTNLAYNCTLNQAIDNNTYRNFNMLLVDSATGFKQSSLIMRPNGVSSIQVPVGKSIKDVAFPLEVPEISSALATGQNIKQITDSASGLAPAQMQGKGGKVSVTMQAKLNADVEARITVMKRNYTEACEELYQFMADITAKRLTKPRKVKIFGYKSITINNVTKKNFKDVKLVARAVPAEDSVQNKAIKQKAKMDLFMAFKDDPKVTGQLAMRRSVAKSFDIEPDEIESWFTAEEQPQPQPQQPAMPQQQQGEQKAPTDATPLLGATQSGAQAQVPKMI